MIIHGDGEYSLLAAYRRACGSGRLAWSKGRWPLGAVLYSSREPSELSQWLCYDDSTINIVVVIIIIIDGLLQLTQACIIAVAGHNFNIAVFLACLSCLVVVASNVGQTVESNWTNRIE